MSTTIMLAHEFMPQVIDGDKTVTIRNGRRDYPLGEACFEDVETQEKTPIYITAIKYCSFNNLLGSDILDDTGHRDRLKLLAELQEFYPDITYTSEVTVVYFNSLATPDTRL